VSAAPVLTAQAGAVRTITLNRPERRNALDLDDRRALLTALRDAEADSGCRAVVLSGAGPIFCSGGDISSMSPDPEVARVRLALVADVARALVNSGTPVVAAVEGGAFGLGLALAAASDLVVAASDARFVASFSNVGLAGDTGVCWSLPRRVGFGRAKRMLLLAETVRAEEALALGLVDEVVEPGSALEAAQELATRLASRASGATAGTKAAMAVAHEGLDAVLAVETDVQTRLLAGAEFAEGQRAFLERRTPDFAGTQR
jgi:2-(1,2-epoxy-1,2-dihydrophenyl)acetyl-CoA isomerase